MHRLFFAFLLIPLSLSAGWLDRKAEGWAWYEQAEEEAVLEKELEKKPKASQRIAKIKEDLEEKLSEALLDPSEENLNAYIAYQKYWIDKSGDFSKAWARFILANPDLDQLTSTPTSQYGIQVHNKKKEEEKKQLFKDLAKDFGLFFFYKGGEIESKALAKVVKIFGQQYAWDVLAISTDGIRLKDFPDSRLSSNSEVEKTPSIFLVNPKNDYMVPVGTGLITIEQIEKNILIQFKR